MFGSVGVSMHMCVCVPVCDCVCCGLFAFSHNFYEYCLNIIFKASIIIATTTITTKITATFEKITPETNNSNSYKKIRKRKSNSNSNNFNTPLTKRRLATTITISSTPPQQQQQRTLRP